MNAPAHLAILDEFGQPLRKKQTRQELASAFASTYTATQEKRKRINARYDAAEETPEFKNYWANADTYDSDSANSRRVRQKLVSRSRYETGNNGYASGITRTFATDVVGKGPKLRMQTASENFNRMVEREFMLWAKQTQLRRKLWAMAHAYDQDGETFGVMRQNAGINHPVKLDLTLHETEECRSPLGDATLTNEVDGIEFDSFGNPTVYSFTNHPGSNGLEPYGVYERIAAKFVCHWFLLERPGQHRGVPIGVSGMNLGAARRRWTEAVVAAAENIADWSVLLKTTLPPDEADAVEPMSTFDIQKRMMVTLPDGYEAQMPKAEQPTAQHGEFTKSLVSEQARPRCMPYNKAASDHSGDSFASGRLDHIPYFEGIDNVNRQDCEDLVLNQLFDVWYDFAIVTYGWLGGNPEAIGPAARIHGWDWPTHVVADQKSDASAKDTKLKSGQTTLAELSNEGGSDYEDRLVMEAESNGLTTDQQRQYNFLVNVPQHLVQAATQLIGLEIETTGTMPGPPPEQEPEPADE